MQGNANTPIWGKQIEAFQGHHERPWTITHRQTCNNLHQSALATMPPLLCFLLLVGNVVGNAYVLLWGTVAMTFIMLAQESHRERKCVLRATVSGMAFVMLAQESPRERQRRERDGVESEKIINVPGVDDEEHLP